MNDDATINAALEAIDATKLERPHGYGSIKLEPSGRYSTTYKSQARGRVDSIIEAHTMLDGLVRSDPPSRTAADDPLTGTSARRGGHRPMPPERQAVRAYLDELRERALSGNGTHVTLGRLDGFPPATDDPDVVERAALTIRARADNAQSSLRELELRQRARTLEAAARRMRTADDSAVDGFIEHGAKYSIEYGVEYATWREIGVPAAVLKQAGIAQ